MPALLLLGLAFGAVIAAGSAAVAVNDAVERWLASHDAAGRRGGGGRTRAALVTTPRGGRPAVAMRRGLLVERSGFRPSGRSGRVPVRDAPESPSGDRSLRT